jgi:hypothetical protein
MDPLNTADTLRPVEMMTAPDPRMVIGSEDRGTVVRRHETIAELELRDWVPNDIRIHFETAKNVLLYAWFVYRFHMVAEQHVLATLEFALRERLKCLNLVPAGKKRPRGLGDWIRLAAASGLIDNSRFEPGQDLARARAEHRFALQVHKKMVEEGLTEFEYDPAQIEIQPEDQLDWILHQAEHLPKLRNIHAHGSDMLYPTVFRTFRIIANLVNQAFEPKQTPEDRTAK